MDKLQVSPLPDHGLHERIATFECLIVKNTSLFLNMRNRQSVESNEKKPPPVPPKNMSKAHTLSIADKNCEAKDQTNKFGHKLVPDQVEFRKTVISNFPDTAYLCGKLYKKIAFDDLKYEYSKPPKKPLKKPKILDFSKYGKGPDRFSRQTDIEEEEDYVEF